MVYVVVETQMVVVHLVVVSVVWNVFVTVVGTSWVVVLQSVSVEYMSEYKVVEL